MPNEHIENVLKLWSSAIDDLNSLASFLSIEKANEQFYRRLFLRNIFSVIETYLHVSKEIVKIKLLAEKNPNDKVSLSELMILNGKYASLDEKGKVKNKAVFQNFLPSLRFTLNIFASEFGCDLPDYNEKEFKLLETLSKRRNDITHPKSLNQLFVTNQEFKDSIIIIDWFIKTHNALNENFIKWLNRSQNELN